jgi:hypothetical protein
MRHFTEAEPYKHGRSGDVKMTEVRVKGIDRLRCNRKRHDRLLSESATNEQHNYATVSIILIYT